MRKIGWLLLLVFIMAVASAGCGGEAAKKPGLNNPSVTKKAPSPQTQNPEPNMERIMADRLSKIAAQVSGVKGATVVVTRNATDADKRTGTDTNTTGYTAMVGIELTADIKGDAAEGVKKQVADKIKSSEKQVTKVLVTTDPNLITRLKDIAAGIIKGKPITGFANEIEELARRIAPTMR